MHTYGDYEIHFAASGSTILYTHWMPRLGDSMCIGCEIMTMGATGTGTLTLQIQHKNLNEAASAAANLGSTFNRTSIGTMFQEVTGCKELLRVKCTLTGQLATVCCRLLPATAVDN